VTNGRAKGSVAEREVAALIQEWWRRLEPDAVFVRTPLSGGWGGPTVRKEFQAAGDLMSTSREFPFAVEVKRREGWKLDRVIAGKKSPVWGWWRQCQKAAVEMGKIPQMWMRQNRGLWLVMMPEPTAEWMKPVFRWDRTYPFFPGVDIGAIKPALWNAKVLLSSEPGTHLMLSFRAGKRRR
jgi:hypothetical protein